LNYLVNLLPKYKNNKRPPSLIEVLLFLKNLTV